MLLPKYSITVLKGELGNGQWGNESALTFQPSWKKMGTTGNQRVGILTLPDQRKGYCYCCQNHPNYPEARGGVGHPVWQICEGFFATLSSGRSLCLAFSKLGKRHQSALQNTESCPLNRSTVMAESYSWCNLPPNQRGKFNPVPRTLQKGEGAYLGRKRNCSKWSQRNKN